MSALRRWKRRLDRRLYALLHRAARLAFPSDAPRGPLPAHAVRRLLWMRHDAAGDLVMTTPALAYLREALPHAELHVLASPRNAALLAGDPRVDRVHVLDASRRGGWWRTARALRAQRYDVVVDTVIPHHLREGVFTAIVAGRHAARVSHRRAKRYTGFFTHAPRPPASGHMVDVYLNVARAVTHHPAEREEPGGAGDAPTRWPMWLAPDAAAEARMDAQAAALRAAAGGGPLIAVNAWSADPRRSLAPALVVALLDALARHHPTAALVLTPPPSAVDGAQAMADAAAREGAAARRVHVLDADLPTLVALVRRAALLVSPDTANVHVAVAVGTPVVSLTVRHLAGVRRYGPRGVPARVVELADGRVLPELTEAEALAAIDALCAEPAVRARLAVGAPTPATST